MALNISAEIVQKIVSDPVLDNNDLWNLSGVREFREQAMIELFVVASPLTSILPGFAALAAAYDYSTVLEWTRKFPYITEDHDPLDRDLRYIFLLSKMPNLRYMIVIVDMSRAPFPGQGNLNALVLPQVFPVSLTRAVVGGLPMWEGLGWNIQSGLALLRHTTLENLAFHNASTLHIPNLGSLLNGRLANVVPTSVTTLKLYHCHLIHTEDRLGTLRSLQNALGTISAFPRQLRFLDITYRYDTDVLWPFGIMDTSCDEYRMLQGITNSPHVNDLRGLRFDLARDNYRPNPIPGMHLLTEYIYLETSASHLQHYVVPQPVIPPGMMAIQNYLTTRTEHFPTSPNFPNRNFRDLFPPKLQILKVTLSVSAVRHSGAGAPRSPARPARAKVSATRLPPRLAQDHRQQ